MWLSLAALAAGAAAADCHLGGLAKSTYATSAESARAGGALLLRALNMTVARDSFPADVAVCPAGTSYMPDAWPIVMGRVETLKAPAMIGSCFYAYIVPAHSAAGCCNACAMDDTARARSTLAAENQTAENFQGECFGLHITSVEGHSDGNASIAFVEAQFTEKLEGLKSFDAFLDYNAALYTQTLDWYVANLEALGLPWLPATWPYGVEKTGYSVFFHVPKTQLVVELVSLFPSHNKVAIKLEQRMTDDRIAQMGALHKGDPRLLVSSTMGLELADVRKKCFQINGTTADVCFVKRGDDATAGDFTVADFEAPGDALLLSGRHAGLRHGPLDGQPLRHRHGHHARGVPRLDPGPPGRALLCPDTHRPGATGGGVHYVIDPTGWGIQMDGDETKIMPGCEQKAAARTRRTRDSGDPGEASTTKNMSTGYATVKGVLTGDTLLLMGRSASNGPPPELQLTLSGVNAPRLARGSGAEAEAKAAGLGQHTADAAAKKAAVRKVQWTGADASSLGATARGVVEFVRDGSNLKCLVVTGEPSEMAMVNVQLAGVRCGKVPFRAPAKENKENGDGDDAGARAAAAAEPFALEAKHFVETRLLHREVSITFCGADKFGNALGCVSHAASGAKIGVAVLKEGLGKVQEMGMGAVDPAEASSMRTAESAARAAKLRVWKGYAKPNLGNIDADFEGVVVEVVSGDQVVVLEEFAGDAAKAFSRATLLQRTVDVSVADMDRNGVGLGGIRLLPEDAKRSRNDLAALGEGGGVKMPAVDVDDDSFESRLLARGFARVDRYRSGDARWAKLEATAKDLKLGLWADEKNREEAEKVAEPKEPPKAKTFRAKVADITDGSALHLAEVTEAGATPKLDAVLAKMAGFAGAADPRRRRPRDAQAPSLEDDYGEDAAKTVHELCWGQDLTVTEVFVRGAEKKMVALKLASAGDDDKTINERLVEAGLAAPGPKYARTTSPRSSRPSRRPPAAPAPASGATATATLRRREVGDAAEGAVHSQDPNRTPTRETRRRTPYPGPRADL
ncbi:hypothetical protein JL722_15238 [Aureococcus anophagefferens]|nr:hypothetical protein JL722_15238 [Aureococcus anophagefferens]